jgi:hypothetical protein
MNIACNVCVYFYLYFVNQNGDVTMKSSLFILLFFLSNTLSAATVFQQDFETSLLGPNEAVTGAFTISNSSPLGNLTYVMGHNSPYSNNEYSAYTITLDFTNVQDAVLTFDYNIDTERFFDKFSILGNGALISPSQNVLSGVQSGQFIGVLAPFSGLGNVVLTFEFTSDGSITDQGVIFDNILIDGTVSSVPIPAAAWLFGSGLIGLIGVARRRKA